MLPFCQKSKDDLLPKNKFPVSLKKMIFIPKNRGISYDRKIEDQN